MNAPRLAMAALSPVEFTSIKQAEDHLLQFGDLQGQTIEKMTQEHPMVDQCYFKGMTFLGDTFERFELTDVVFENCTLANCQLTGASWYRVQFKNCKLVGTTLDHAVLKDVAFQDCDLSLANLNQAKLTNVTFTDSRLQELNCLETQLRQVKLGGCDLDAADFTETSLKKIDLTTCTFTTLQVTAVDVRGCRMTTEQAAYCAQLFLGVDWLA
ncbi:pentapeptide repeat-containing protein [Levilactobacillus tongjiangensis]|uniref:Pentapeptide repeat-containing protein n=1 Tax=Levilactobacillus tongjiangensis TaxID=2486023 RepID=A0ABW1SRZ8_9LACO|nr:pentapeptide repeat-containing protein [Levilactobacillus tongjiangensis]